VKIRLVVTGRGYHAAGHLPEEWEVAEDATVDDVIRLLREIYGDGPGWSATCLIAVAGRHLGTVASHEPAGLRDGDEVTLIAPVAGG
jgi:molybdopterin converting factor small subunit